MPVRTPKEAAQYLAALARSAGTAIAAALREEAEIEATEAKRRTPVDTGTLRSTITVAPVRLRGRTYTTAIEAGGPAAPYAVIVHENLEAFHKVGQAKYIESVLNESAPYMLLRVARNVHRRLT
jgi:hypothetical protein